MNRITAMGMTAEDCLVCRIFIGFMMTPLALLISIGATLALAS